MGPHRAYRQQGAPGGATGRAWSGDGEERRRAPRHVPWPDIVQELLCFGWRFDAFTHAQRKGFLWWVKSAKRERTRAERITHTVRCAARNIKEPRKIGE